MIQVVSPVAVKDGSSEGASDGRVVLHHPVGSEEERVLMVCMSSYSCCNEGVSLMR